MLPMFYLLRYRESVQHSRADLPILHRFTMFQTSEALLTGLEDPLSTDRSPMPDPDQPAELAPPKVTTKEWLERAGEIMHRMSIDEEYRKEIAKSLF